MIQLPASLATWAPQLSVLPDDLALTLAPWIGRLSLAIGPLAASHRPGSGDFDGYAGLARRGSYERLVTTEWGVADLFPDEFLRRAAGGEHLFLDLARREPKAALRSIAIISAGPLQLGAPRLAHVAVLAVLARRAAAAGAAFAWGVLEDREHRLHGGLDEPALRALLSARTALSAAPDALGEWSAALDADARDLWLVGAEADAAAAAKLGASRIVVRDVLEPGVRALDVEVARRGTHARVRLDLPAPERCARLLRDPFERRAAARTSAAAGRGVDVRFSPSGGRLIVRLAGGEYETWPVPSSPNDLPGNPRRWVPPGGHTVVAVGIGRRSVLAATARRDDPDALELHYGNSLRARVALSDLAAAELRTDLRRLDAPPVGACAIMRFSRDQPAQLILHVLGRLLVVQDFALWPRPGTTLVARLHPGSDGGRPRAIAPTFFRESFVWGAQSELGQIHIHEATANATARMAFVGARAEPDLHFGFSLPERSDWGVASVAWDEGRRRVVGPKLDARTIACPYPAVGVCMRYGEVALLVRPEPHRLAWLVGERLEYLPAANAAIERVAVCATRPHVAWVTETGEMVVYSLQHNAVVLRRQPKGDA